VLVLGEAQQGHRVVRALRVLAQEDRVFALQLRELGRIGRHHADLVAELGAEVGADAQVLVRDVVEQLVAGHRESRMGCAAPALRTGTPGSFDHSHRPWAPQGVPWSPGPAKKGTAAEATVPVHQCTCISFLACLRRCSAGRPYSAATARPGARTAWWNGRASARPRPSG